MRCHETELLTQVLSALQGRNSVRVLGTLDAQDRAPTVAMALNRPAESVAAKLANHGIMTCCGDFYAVRALKALGIDPTKEGVLRISFTHYTSQSEINQLLEGLDNVL
jgi:selenocysteine lyase/cysteine desulfurase